MARSHTACFPPVPEPLGTNEKRKGPNWRRGRDWVTPRAHQSTVPRASQRTRCTPLQGKGISHSASTALSRSLWEQFLLQGRFRTKKKKKKDILDISPHPPEKNRNLKKSFLHIKIPSLQRHSCSYCFRANIIGYVFSKRAVFQTRWFLSSHRETETTQSQQCSAPRQWHPHFGGRQKDDS